MRLCPGRMGHDLAGRGQGKSWAGSQNGGWKSQSPDCGSMYSDPQSILSDGLGLSFKRRRYLPFHPFMTGHFPLDR